MNTNPANFVLHEITDSCERLFQRFGIGSNGSGYPFEKKCHPFERLWLSVGKRNVIPSNDSGYPFVKNCHPFEQLGLSVGKNCHPFGRLGLSVRRKLLSVRTARVILSNGSSYPFKTIVSHVTVQSHLHPSRLRRNCQKKSCKPL